MEKLIAKAKKFLDENFNYNEIELSDSKGNKVRLVRYTPPPTITYTYPSFTNPDYNPYGPSPY